jgi:hypothetical protein
VIIEYAPLSIDGDPAHGAQQLTFDTSGFVQMELAGLGSDPAVGDGVMDDPKPARRASEPDTEG